MSTRPRQCTDHRPKSNLEEQWALGVNCAYMEEGLLKGTWKTQRQLHRQKSIPAWILAKKVQPWNSPHNLQLDQQQSWLPMWPQRERSLGWEGSAKFQELPASSAASLHYGLFHSKTFWGLTSLSPGFFVEEISCTIILYRFKCLSIWSPPGGAAGNGCRTFWKGALPEEVNHTNDVSWGSSS